MVELELARRTELRSTLVGRLWPRREAQTLSSDEGTSPASARLGPDSESSTARTASTTWPAGGASACAPEGRPACWPKDAKPTCLQFGGAEIVVAPAAVRVRPVRAFWGGGGDVHAPQLVPPLNWEEAERQRHTEEVAQG